MEGFIQLHKKICEWEWYTDIPTCKLFFHILIKCNYKENKWRGKTIKPGEFYTSLEHLSIETGLTKQQIRTAINKLKSTGEISHKSTNDYTILGLTNWHIYNTPNNTGTTNEQQTNNKRTTTTNNDNIYNKDNKENKGNEKELREYISDKSNESITYYVIKYFFELGWKPAEDETIETIRKWIQEVMKENGIDSSEKMKGAIDRWYEYWKGEKKQKNIKSTFRNTIKYSK